MVVCTGPKNANAQPHPKEDALKMKVMYLMDLSKFTQTLNAKTLENIKHYTHRQDFIHWKDNTTIQVVGRVHSPIAKSMNYYAAFGLPLLKIINIVKIINMMKYNYLNIKMNHIITKH